MQATIPVTHTPCIGVTPGDLGNDVPSYGTPVQRMAHAYGTHRSEVTAGHTSRDTAVMDLALPTVGVKLLDRFTVNGDEFEVVGVRDNNGGFHGWMPGIVVELKRVTG